MGEGEDGQEATAARDGARKGSVARVVKVKVKVGLEVSRRGYRFTYP